MRSNLTFSMVLPFILSSNLAIAQQKPAICDFIERVVAAKANDFATIRGAEAKVLGVSSGLYKGKIVPNPNASCNIGPQSVRNGRTEAAIYMCEVGRAKTMAAIKPLYDQLREGLARCYPDIQFKVGAKGNDQSHNETWFVSGRNARVTLTLQAMDSRFMTDSVPELANDKTKNTPANLSLRIRPSL